MAHGNGLAHGIASAAARGREEGVGPVLLDGVSDLSRGQVDSLVPRNALPGHLLRASCARALQRIEHTVGAVAVVQLIEALHAQRAEGRRSVGMALDLGDDAVFHIHAGRARLNASAAGRHIGLAAAVGRGALGIIGPGLLHLGELARVPDAERRRSAGERSRLYERASCQAFTRH